MIKAKKHFGQNWLNSDSALNKIVDAGEVNTGDLVVEVGPGQGALTEKILATGARVLAIEIDEELITILNDKFTSEIKTKQLQILHRDILTIDLKKLVGSKKYKLIANIPYYITGAIFEHFLQSNAQPERAVLLVQKEVAKRIIATDKKESILSLSVKVFSEPKYIATVPAGAFVPAPNVDSAILALTNIKNNLSEAKTTSFFKLIKQGFAGKRKQLKNNLPDYQDKMKSCNILPTARAEDLTLEDWLCLNEA